MSTRSFLRRTPSAILPTALYVALAAVLFGVLSVTLGPVPSVEIALSLPLAGLLPGTALVRRLFRQPSVMHYLVLGTIIGLGLLAVGGMLSHLTGLTWIRWVPSVLGVLLWALPLQRVVPERSVPRGVPLLAILGSLAATAGMLPALRTALASQPTHWSGWYRFFADLPFDVALTSEVATRAPQDYPWVANTPLSYPWLYHSAMGVWASVTNVASSDLVLQAWPVLFVILIPAAIAITAWELTRNRYVAMVAPLIYVFGHGIVVTPLVLQQVPLLQISPTRDFADLYILLAALSLVRLFRARSLRASGTWWYVALGIFTFVATGAKGSSMPILAGGVVAATLILLVSRRLCAANLLTVAVFAVTAATSFALTLPAPGSTQSLAWGPLTFLSPQTPNRIAVSVVFLALVLIAIAGCWLVIGITVPGSWGSSSLLAGILLAGLMGLSLFTHPAGSQLYFWENAQPILAIVLAWAGVLATREYGLRILAAAVGVFLISKGVERFGLEMLARGGIVVLSAGIAIVVLRLIRNWRPLKNWRRLKNWRPPTASKRTTLASVLVSLAFVAVLTQAAQIISISPGTVGGAVSKASNSGAIDESQLAAYTFIENHSSPDNRVITNKHCLAGSGDTCDARWFAIAAFSERRVLVEGWAYTQHGTSPIWIEKDLDLSQRFTTSPTASDRRALVSLDVRFVYVDKRDPYSRDGLARFAKLVFSSKWAAIYSLR